MESVHPALAVADFKWPDEKNCSVYGKMTLKQEPVFVVEFEISAGMAAKES